MSSIIILPSLFENTNPTLVIKSSFSSKKFKNLQIGDTLLINNQTQFLVVGKRIYHTFAEMLKTEGINKVIPGANNLSGAEAVYYKFYNPEDENQFGVVAIEIKKI